MTNNDLEIKKVISLYEQLQSTRKVAKELGFGKTKVNKILKENKIELRKSGLKDRTGFVYGELTVIKRGPNRTRFEKNSKRTISTWWCSCTCGLRCILVDGNALNGGQRSCGCVPTYENLKGKKFGRLTVIKKAPNKGIRTSWFCRCSCGNTELVQVLSSCLKNGSTQSCGCLSKEIARRNASDHSGERIGDYRIIKRCDGYWNDGEEKGFYDCICDCGRVFKRNVSNLYSTESCGYCGEIKTEEIKGMTFNNLKAIEFSHVNKHQHSVWLFACKCGKKKKLVATVVKQGVVKSCGCLQKEAVEDLNLERREKVFKRVIGKKFGLLTCTKHSRDEIVFQKNKSRTYCLFECLCECGKTKEARAYDLESGRIVSCGCKQNFDSLNLIFNEKLRDFHETEWLYLFPLKRFSSFYKIGIAKENSGNNNPSEPDIDRPDKEYGEESEAVFWLFDKRVDALLVEQAVLSSTIINYDYPPELENWRGRSELRLCEKNKLIEVIQYFVDLHRDMGRWKFALFNVPMTIEERDECEKKIKGENG